MKNNSPFPRVALAFLAMLTVLASTAGASYIVELTYSGGTVTQTGVYYTNAEPSSPGGNFTYSVAGSTGSIDFSILEMHDAKNNETDAPSSFAPMVKKTEAVAYIVVPDSALPSSGTGTGENLKIMNGTQILLDEPLKPPTRLVPSVAPQAGQTTQTTTGSSTETTTPGTTSKGDDGAGFDLLMGFVIGAVVVVAILVFLRRKKK